MAIQGAANQRRFLYWVDGQGQKFFACREVLTQLKDVKSRASSDTVPVEVWNRVKTILAERNWTEQDFALATNTRFDGSKMWTHSPGRKRLRRIARVFDSQELDDLATNDVLWDRIVEIESIGEHDVYDGTVSGTHNFVANLVSLHNSLEQDADMVMLLHRPDAFDREDPRGGEADIILGKHRNGPTANITVAHQLHLSRFTNMAR